MSFSQLILKDYADIVWPLDDLTPSASSSSPISFFYPNSLSYSASINVSNTDIQSVPMIYGGGNLLQFTASGVGLSIPAIGRFSSLYQDKNSVMAFWLKVDRVDSEEQPIFKKRGEDNVGLFIKNDYLIFKFGDSASYSQVVGPMYELNEPHYIVVGAGPGFRSLIIDGVENRIVISSDQYPSYSASHSINNYIDFYGPRNGFWEIDSPALYPNLISSEVAKRHYVYGLGKWVSDSVFFSRGGNIYNFTTIETEKASEITWDYPEEWKLSEFIDLDADDTGIKPLFFSPPQLLSFDNNITKNGNKIKFSSSSVTFTSYIDVTSVTTKIIDGSYPVFVKFTLDGPLPVDQLYQRLVSYGNLPDVEMLNIDLINDNDQYKVRFSANGFTGSAAFNIENISSSPSIYVGFKFDSSSQFYFAQSGSVLQVSSFNYLSASGYGVDPLLPFFPPSSETIVRIGGTLVYDLRETTPQNAFDIYQYYGSFEKLLVLQKDFIDSISNFDDIESYKKDRYGFYFNTDEDRFVISTYGKGSFNLHGVEIGEYVDSNTSIISSNIIEIGYPDIISASNVVFNVTEYSYSGSITQPTIKLDKKNYLPYINSVNISDKYLKFDFEIYTRDLLYYPPKIKYFHMETYKENNKKTMLRDDAGVPYLLHQNSSSVIFLPETRLTPTIFLRDDSGIRLQGNIVDFSEQIYPVPLDPRDIPNLILWIDSRYPLGLRRFQYLDDYRVDKWTDLSGNEFHAYQSSSAFQPVYRIQSLNLFTYTQLSGSEPDSLINIIPVNSSIESSNYGAVSGTKAISVIPNSTSINSYIDLGYNAASITVFPNQSYSAVGTIKLNKRQTASALFEYARRIAVFNSDGVTETLAGLSSQADNSAGIYSLSVTFSTASTTTQSFIRYYNGSYKEDDVVYWDNLGLYPISGSVAYGSGGSASIVRPITSWALPLTEQNDHPVLKFDGTQTFMETAASVSQPYTMFIVGRAFNNGVFVGYSASGGSFYTYDGNYYISTGSAQVQVPSTSDYNIYTVEVNSGSAKFYLNGEGWYLKETGSDDINGLLLGKGALLDSSENYLAGDLSAVVLYSGKLDYQTRSAIENWLDESFNLLSPVIGLTPLNDKYLDEYTFKYPIEL